MRVLAGDIGGTKTVLAHYEGSPGEGWERLDEQRYASGDHVGLGPILRDFLGRTSVDAAAFGIAGPVRDGLCRITNLPWEVRQSLLEEQLGGVPVSLYNDLQAAALGMAVVDEAHLEWLQRGRPEPAGVMALVGAGTGLGISMLVPTANGPRVFATEGGHADLAPRNPVEVELLRFLQRRHGRVSVERAISGTGLRVLHQFVVEQGLAESLPGTREAMEQGDAGAVIGELGLAGADAACARAVALFASMFGSKCGNVGLNLLPTGGLFLTGGVALKLLPALREGSFMESLLDKGRMRPVLEQLPVAAVTEPRLALLGAREAAAASLRR